MFKFLFILFFLIILLLLGFSAIRFLAQLFFGVYPGNKKSQFQSSEETQTNTQNNTNRKPKKIISPDEGEYIDYEEIPNPPFNK